jgi:hypothetical protein
LQEVKPVPVRVKAKDARAVSVNISLPPDLEEIVTKRAVGLGIARSHLVAALLRRALQEEPGEEG